MTNRAVFSCFLTLLIILPIFGRNIQQKNVNDYDRIVEHNVKQILPADMDTKAYNDMVRRFWTPERMASAKPLNFFKTRSEFEAEHRAPMTMNSERTPPQINIPGVPAKSLKASPLVVGKIFGQIGSSTYVCSGSVIVSENGDTVLTAGHCVYDTDTNTWSSNLIFVPGYDSGSTPYEVWVWKTAAVLRAWTQAADFNYDVAVVLLATSDKEEHIQDITGSLGMTVNKPKQAQTVSYGYPVNIHKGEILASCSDLATAAEIPQLPSYNGLRLPCNMTGGSSGGPWTQDDSYQTSVNSFGIVGEVDVMYGPYFDDNVLHLWEQYEKQ